MYTGINAATKHAMRVGNGASASMNWYTKQNINAITTIKSNMISRFINSANVRLKKRTSLAIMARNADL